MRYVNSYNTRDLHWGEAISSARDVWRPRETPDFWPKLMRALGRQAPSIICAVATGATLAGVQTLLGAPAPWPSLFAAWSAWGLFVGLVLAGGREILRNAVDVRALQKNAAPLFGLAPIVAPSALRQLPPDQRTPPGVILNQPASAFATAYRELQNSLPNQCAIAFIGPQQGVGATTAALCMALSAAQQGRRVVAVDADLRHRGLTHSLGLAPAEGVLEACDKPEDWRRLLLEEPETGLHILPAARPASPWRSLLAPGGLPRLIDNLKAEYDLVVLDCPSAISAEGLAIARFASRGVVIATWDETPMAGVMRALRRLRGKIRNVGVYLNRAPRGLSQPRAGRF